MDEKNGEIPSMEDLAGTSLMAQIENTEKAEEVRMSNRNRLGSKVTAKPDEESKD